MALRRNDNVSVSVTRHADGAITGSVSGAASDVGDVVERFGRGVGYGIERARLETGGGVYTSKCYECERSLSTANQAFYHCLTHNNDLCSSCRNDSSLMNQYRYRNCEYVQRQHTTLAITSGYSRCFECEKGISKGKEYYYHCLTHNNDLCSNCRNDSRVVSGFRYRNCEYVIR